MIQEYPRKRHADETYLTSNIAGTGSRGRKLTVTWQQPDQQKRNKINTYKRLFFLSFIYQRRTSVSVTTCWS